MPEIQGTERYQRTEAGLPVVGLEAWARSVEGGGASESASFIVRREVELLTRAVDTTAKTITIVAGTSTVDRYRDRIMVAGYDDAQFRRNPIMPWCHEYWTLPVAQGVNPRIEGDAYVIEAAFADTSRIYPFANMVWEMYAARILRMASVGGMPTKWTRDEVRGGMDVTGFDLWEVSLCPLGVNPEAMAKAKLNGIDATPMDEWARQVADAGGSLVLSKERAEAVVRALGYGKGLSLFELDPAAIVALRAEADPEKEEEKPEPEEEAEKPKPHQKDESTEDEPAAAEPEAEPEEKAADTEDADMILLDLDEPANDPPPAADEDEMVELDVSTEELQAAVTASVAAAFAEMMTETPRVEAR